jgi:hypothetical protein
MKDNQTEINDNQKEGLVPSPAADVQKKEDLSGEQKYLYFEGRPREYRFNGQNGQFNLYGDRVLTDASGRLLSTFSFQPIAYRIFEDCLFGRSVRELWAELFFVDSDNCVASIMFNNTSVNELYRLLEPILYERKSLCDVILRIKPERVQSKNDPSKSWYIARFAYEPAKPELIAEMREYVKTHRVYRGETLTVSAQHKLVSQGYHMAIDPLDDYSLQQQAA